MDIKDFVEQTLTQITADIEAAQKKPNGAIIAPMVRIMYPQHNHAPVMEARGGLFQVWPVRFDLAVTVTTGSEQKGGAGISIMSIGQMGAQKSGRSESVEVSRIIFDVPVHWPLKSKEELNE